MTSLIAAIGILGVMVITLAITHLWINSSFGRSIQTYKDLDAAREVQIAALNRQIAAQDSLIKVQKESLAYYRESLAYYRRHS